MKRTRSWILSAILLVALATGGFASGSGEKGAASGATKDLKAEITVWCYPSFEGYDTLLGSQVQASLNKTYPNIKVNAEMLSWDTGPEKTTVAYASGATPDILFDGAPRLMPGITKGLCVPVDDILTSLKDALHPQYLNPVVYEGRNYYLPLSSSNGYTIAVNSALAKKIGVYDKLPADKVHWSYDQFLGFCRAVRANAGAGDVYPAMLWAGSRSSDSAYYSLMMSAGASILNKEHTKCTASSENGVKALTLLQTLVKEDLVPKGAATSKDDDMDAAFWSGKLIMYLASAGAQDVVRAMLMDGKGELNKEVGKIEVFMYPTPDGKADPRVLNWGISGFGLFKNKNNADKIAASKLYAMEVLSNTQIGATICKSIGAVPALKAVVVDFGDAWVNEQFRIANGWSVKYSTSDMGILEPWWTQVRETFFPEMQALYIGEKTPKQALDSFAVKVDAIIAKETKK